MKESKTAVCPRARAWCRDRWCGGRTASTASACWRAIVPRLASASSLPEWSAACNAAISRWYATSKSPHEAARRLSSRISSTMDS